VVGNSVKAGVRFVTYDKFKQALADKDVSSVSSHHHHHHHRHRHHHDLSRYHDWSAHWIYRAVKGKVSAPRSLLAGLGAGMVEAIIAVTPSETIKYDIASSPRSSVPFLPIPSFRFSKYCDGN
jgi:solute carrier family 25 citrate transporter 1